MVQITLRACSGVMKMEYREPAPSTQAAMRWVESSVFMAAMA